MLELKLHQKHVDKFKNQYPLIFKETLMWNYIQDHAEEGTLIKLTDEGGRYIATGYYGLQNKGIGWVLTQNQKEDIGFAFFQRKIYMAVEKRLGLYNNPKTSAFRVFNGEGDGIGGLTIDFFDGYYLISWYSKGIYAFRDLILKALSASVQADGIYEKMRFETDITLPDDGFVEGSKATFPIIVKENGAKLAVYFNDGAMVGFFMDQREVRKALRDSYSKGKNVLNTFSYTGAFSIFAALGGAKKTVSVDLSGRSLERTQEHFRLNHIDDATHDILVEDVFHYFKWAEKKHLTFDTVILDPPSFAKSKDFTFSSEKDYPDLLAKAIKLTVNHGTLIASTNTSTFDMDKFKQMIGKGFQIANARFEILETFQLPKDYRTNRFYPASDYLKVIIVKVLHKKG